MGRPLMPGDVVTVRFPEHRPPGHEQHGLRPAIVVGVPETLGKPRFPVILLTPLTTDRRQPWAARSPALYPPIPAGIGGLPSPSLALLDQTRAVGVDRLVGYIGRLPTQVYRPVRSGLLRMLAGPGQGQWRRSTSPGRRGPGGSAGGRRDR